MVQLVTIEDIPKGEDSIQAKIEMIQQNQELSNRRNKSRVIGKPYVASTNTKVYDFMRDQSNDTQKEMNESNPKEKRRMSSELAENAKDILQALSIVNDFDTDYDQTESLIDISTTLPSRNYRSKDNIPKPEKGKTAKTAKGKNDQTLVEKNIEPVIQRDFAKQESPKSPKIKTAPKLSEDMRSPSLVAPIDNGKVLKGEVPARYPIPHMLVRRGSFTPSDNSLTHASQDWSVSFTKMAKAESKNDVKQRLDDATSEESSKPSNESANSVLDSSNIIESSGNEVREDLCVCVYYSSPFSIKSIPLVFYQPRVSHSHSLFFSFSPPFFFKLPLYTRL